MKRTIVFKLIALVLLVATLAVAIVPSFAGCGEEEQPPKTTTPSPTTPSTPKEEEPEQPKEKDIPDELNLALQIDKLPKATTDMTPDELRDVVVAFMKLQLTFAYKADFSKASEDEMGYYIKNLYSAYDASKDLDNIKIMFEDGKYYGGMPYMGNTAGSVYRWLEFYNAEDGRMDWSPILRTDRKNWTDSDTGRVYPSVGSSIFGNTCASSCVWAYLRVSNSISTFWTSTWIPKNGYVKIGDYKLSSNDDHGTSTKKICTNNGSAKMYECYAQMKKADGLVQTGHAVMITENAVVVYKEDGKTIDPEKSYVWVAEQKASFLNASPEDGGKDLYSPLNNKGLTYRIQGNFPNTIVNGKEKDMRWSFKKLYDEGYLPFTIPELVGTDDFEEPEVRFSHKSETITMSELQNKTITSNYAISDVHFTVKDKEGNVVFTAMYAPSATSVVALKSYNLNNALNNNTIYKKENHIYNGLDDYAFKGYTLEISARISTGDLVTVWSGTYKK